MQILDGKSLSGKLKDDIIIEFSTHKRIPILAVITIGDDSSSEVYVRNKKKACEYVGFSFMHFSYTSDTKENIIIKKIKELNKDDTVNGILLQLPIPEKYDVDKILNTIDPKKDVDGLTNVSMGKLMNRKYE